MMPMTATTDRAALYRSILERPEDDVVRRVFADYLRDNGEETRADFIEVQLELAEMEPCASSGNWIKCVELPSECRYCCLRRREVELWTDYKFCGRLEGEKLFGACPWASAVDLRKTRLGTGTFAAVSRGFVSAARCTIADWVGGPCERCGGTGFPGGEPSHMMAHSPRLCHHCHAAGRTPAHGPRIVAEQPVETLALSDCKPDPGSGDVWFFAEEWIAMMPDAVADEVDDLCWSESELAESFLARALLNWARREAGLPPLREHATA